MFDVDDVEDVPSRARLAEPEVQRDVVRLLDQAAVLFGLVTKSDWERAGAYFEAENFHALAVGATARVAHAADG